MNVNRTQRYEIVKQLGSGGTSTVYLVHDNTLDTRWAMKRYSLEDASAFTWKSEIAFLTQLQHPAIVRIVDGWEDDEYAYYIMDYIEGMSLHQYIATYGKAKEAIVRDWAIQLLEVIGYLHKHDVLYCDLKLENIMISASGSLSLIDFGAALSSRSFSTIRYGTIGYAAPEQFLQTRLDERCDIYSLGKVLIACLYGILDAKTIQDIPEHDATFCSLALYQILCIACAKKREQRYGSTTAMQQALAIPKQKGRLLPNVKTAMLLGWASVMLVIGVSCSFIYRKLQIAAYQEAMQANDYERAIAYRTQNAEPFYALYERYYEDAYTTFRKQYEAKEAKQKAIMEAIVKVEAIASSARVPQEEAYFYFMGMKCMESENQRFYQKAATYYFYQANNYVQAKQYQQIAAIYSHEDSLQKADIELLDETLASLVLINMENENYTERTTIALMLARLYNSRKAELPDAAMQRMIQVCQDALLHCREQEVILELVSLMLDGYEQQITMYRKQGKQEAIIPLYQNMLALYESYQEDIDDNALVVARKANIYLNLYQETKQKQDLLQAFTCFDKALLMDPNLQSAIRGKSDCERLLLYERK